MLLFYIASVSCWRDRALMFGGLRHASDENSFRRGHLPGAGVILLLVLLVIVGLLLYLYFLFWLAMRDMRCRFPRLSRRIFLLQNPIRRSIHLSRGSKGRLYALLLWQSWCRTWLLTAVMFHFELMAFNPFHPHHALAWQLAWIVVVCWLGIVSILMSAFVDGCSSASRPRCAITICGCGRKDLACAAAATSSCPSLPPNHGRYRRTSRPEIFRFPDLSNR